MELYEITDIVPRTEITRKGETLEKREIFFTTMSDIRDSIIVDKELSEDEVKERVKSEAQKIEGLMGHSE